MYVKIGYYKKKGDKQQKIPNQTKNNKPTTNNNNKTTTEKKKNQNIKTKQIQRRSFTIKQQRNTSGQLLALLLLLDNIL